MMLPGLTHPKTLDLCARLDVSRPQVIGHLELLWAFAAQQAPRGNIGKWPDGAIARAADWAGEPTVFVSALVDAGFLDESEEHRYVIHDWQDHCPRYVRAKLAKSGEDFADARDCSGDYSSDCSSDSRADSPRARCQAKPSQATSSQGGNGDPDKPDAAGAADTVARNKPTASTKSKLTSSDVRTNYGVSSELAQQFMQVRRGKRQPLTPLAMERIVGEFGKAGLSITEGLTLCCERSWAGFKASWEWRDDGDKSNGSTSDSRHNETSAGRAMRRNIELAQSGD